MGQVYLRIIIEPCVLSVFTVFETIVDAVEHFSLHVLFLFRIDEPSFAPATYYQLINQ